MRDPNQKVSVDQKTGRVRVQTVNREKSMTQQQFAAECDINNIMDKYTKTGEFTVATKKNGQYADFTGITDYREMLDTVRYAEEAFMLLPAKIRSRFGNDPQQLLDFVQDNKNYDEGVKLGLVQPKQKPQKGAPSNDESNDDNNEPKKPTKKQPTES